MTKQTLPPHNAEAEQALIGALLVNPRALAEVRPIINDADFYIAKHGFIFNAIQNLAQRGDPVDTVTVSDELDAMGHGTDVSGADVVGLIADVVNTLHAVPYAHIIKSTSTRRRLLQHASQVAQLANNDGLGINEVLDRIESNLQALREGQTGFSRLRSMSQVASDVWEQQRAARDHGAGVFMSGYPDLDRLTGGHRKGSLVILGSRPGVGKTALLLNLAERATDNGRGVLIFSLEMTSEGLAHRMLASNAGINLTRLSTSDLSNDDWDKLPRALDTLGKRSIWVDDTPSLALTELCSRAKRLAARVPISLIAVDYLQLVTTNAGQYQKRYLELGQISAGLKALAKETGTTVLAASQLNRSVEQRQVKRPTLADLRESGNLEQDADTVWLLYREKDEPSTDLIIAKNRWGKTGMVPLFWQGDRVSFVPAEVRELGGL